MLKRFIESRPATFTVLITFLSVGVLFVAKLFEPEAVPLFNWPRLILLAVISAAVFSILRHMECSVSSGLTTPISAWQGRWVLATIPLLLIALLSLTSVDWQSLNLTTINVVAWLLSNFATGFFEEVLMRGLCFYILLQAWGATRSGVFKAAFFQAFVFGAAHLANLYHMPMLDVFAQVVFATLIGVGFAGLVYLSKSLWPAIFVHTLINASGTINDFLVVDHTATQSPGIIGYMVIVVIFLVLSAVPGLMYLRACTSQLIPNKG